MAREFKWFTKEEIASWPADHKKCRVCQEVLPFSNFHKNKKTLFGINTECKDCRIPKSKNQWKYSSLELRILNRTRTRANQKGLLFDLKIEDIYIPQKCPVFNLDFIHEIGHDLSPSIDRIIPALGYVRSNIQIISNLANRIKSNANAQQVRAVADYMQNTL